MRLQSQWRSCQARTSAGSVHRPGRIVAALVHCFVALVLVFAQREASLHWLSHATEAAVAKHSLMASSDVCDECLSISGLDNVAHAEPPSVAALHVPPVLEPATSWVSAASLLRLGYASRGPPIAG